MGCVGGRGNKSLLIIMKKKYKETMPRLLRRQREQNICYNCNRCLSCGGGGVNKILIANITLNHKDNMSMFWRMQEKIIGRVKYKNKMSREGCGVGWSDLALFAILKMDTFLLIFLGA